MSFLFTKIKSFEKCTILLCIFFMLAACTNEQSSHSRTDDNKESQQASTELVQTPLLSLNELLNADDVKNSLALAAANDDIDALQYWQQELLTAAGEVSLLESERKLISGKQGLVYIQFQGMKTNYQRDFDEAFFGFGDIDAVYAKYPAFTNAHEQSRELVEKRDALIQKVSAELDIQGFDGDTTDEARRQWLAFVSQNGKSSSP